MSPGAMLPIFQLVEPSFPSTRSNSCDPSLARAADGKETSNADTITSMIATLYMLINFLSIVQDGNMVL